MKTILCLFFIPLSEIWKFSVAVGCVVKQVSRKCFWAECALSTARAYPTRTRRPARGSLSQLAVPFRYRAHNACAPTCTEFYSTLLLQSLFLMHKRSMRRRSGPHTNIHQAVWLIIFLFFVGRMWQEVGSRLGCCLLGRPRQRVVCAGGGNRFLDSQVGYGLFAALHADSPPLFPPREISKQLNQWHRRSPAEDKLLLDRTQRADAGTWTPTID